MEKIMTRMGSGFPVEISESQLMEDLTAGSEDAADRGKISQLSTEELEYLFDLFISPDRFVSVASGNEIVLSYDGGPLKMIRAGVDVHRIQSMQIYEKILGADSIELGHIDYSFKPVKPILGTEQTVLEQTLLATHAPLFYGAMPNLGLYSQPDGPFPNPSELMPLGKIAEARDSYEKAVEDAVKDIVFVGSAMYESGADGINMDTTGAAGDADFLAGLRATEILKEKYPDICIELGMAGEFILGLHGELEYNGTRLAGLYAHDQLKLAEKAGVTIFGPVVNIKPSKSCPWNLSRVITFIKACCEGAEIPVHPNMGMGVGGVPIVSHPPVDITSRASKAMVEICRLDGLQVGAGDPMGMAISHAIASGMGGMRAAGDLVARMQMTRGMKIGEAKKYVADKLKIAVSDLTDPVIMTEIREDLELGSATPLPGCAKGIEAKLHIADVLDIEINCIRRLKNKGLL